MNRARWAATLALTLLVGAALITPSGAHVTDRFGHVWRDHVKPRLAEAGEINRARNPVDWTKLKGVPAGLADGVDDIGVTPEELEDLKSDLAAADAAVNEAGDPVSWFNLKDVPADFADGADAVGGGGGSSTATDLTCTGCVGIPELSFDPATQTELDSLEGALDDVATSGAYSDLSGTPNLATVATSGAYSDLTGTPTLATVATTGDYDDLTDKPALAAIATTGDWDDLTDVPSDIADGDDIDGGTAADVDCTGCVSAVDVTTVDADALTSSNIKNDTLTAADLATNSVGADELADLSVDTDALQDGAVTTDKMEANYSIASPTAGTISTLGPIPAFLDVATASVLFTEDTVHNVLVNGQALVNCPNCTGPTNADITWELLRDGAVVVNTQTAARLDGNGSMLVASLTHVDETSPPAAPGDYAHSYTLRVNVTAINESSPGLGDVHITAGQLNAVDIGLASP